MARTSKGWSLERDPRTGILKVRFTFGGTRHHLSTGARDSREAEVEAARIYAAVVTGQWAAGKVLPTTATRPLDEVASLWLAEIEPSIDPRTFKLYQDTYVGTHFESFFGSMDKITSVGCEGYIAKRLREVSRETVKKEICALRRFCKWATKRGHLAAMPDIETPGPKVVGTPVGGSRKRQYLIFTAAEVEGIIAKLPERTTAPRCPAGFWVKRRIQVLWETGLRPATIAKIEAPGDYAKGRAELTIRAEADKNRWGREMPLSDGARAALDAACPVKGLIFGSHDCRLALRKAAVEAGIDNHRASKISEYDLRHSRLTDLGQHTDNLSGLMFLAGHKQPATTARYLRPQQDAAREVLESVEGRVGAKAAGKENKEFKRKARIGGRHMNAGQKQVPVVMKNMAEVEFANDNSGDSGPIVAPESKSRRLKPEDDRSEKVSNSEVVRGGGLEPPWLLTASTSS